MTIVGPLVPYNASIGREYGKTVVLLTSDARIADPHVRALVIEDYERERAAHPKWGLPETPDVVVGPEWDVPRRCPPTPDTTFETMYPYAWYVVVEEA